MGFFIKLFKFFVKMLFKLFQLFQQLMTAFVICYCIQQFIIQLIKVFFYGADFFFKGCQTILFFFTLCGELLKLFLNIF